MHTGTPKKSFFPRILRKNPFSYQFFFGSTSGNVRSYNYNGGSGSHLANQDQAICVRYMTFWETYWQKILFRVHSRRERSSCRWVKQKKKMLHLNVNVRIHILAIFLHCLRICFYAASATDFAVSGAGYCRIFIFPKFLYVKPLQAATASPASPTGARAAARTRRPRQRGKNISNKYFCHEKTYTISEALTASTSPGPWTLQGRRW